MNTYLNQDPIDLRISSKNKADNFKLYFDYNEEIVKGRVTIVITIGMKIEDKKLAGNVNKPFNDVLIPDKVKKIIS